MIAIDLANLEVAIRSYHGTYLCAEPESIVKTMKHVGTWERWTIIPLDKTEFAIRSSHNKYLCAHGRRKGEIVDQTTNIGTWERFKLINQPNDLWAIQSVAHGTYIRTHASGKVELQEFICTEEKYSIKILSKPEIVKNLKYNFNKKEIVSEKPMTIFTMTLENNHDKSSNFKYAFKEGISKSFVFTQNRGVKIGINTKLFAGIPEIVEVDLERSRMMEWNWSSGTELITTSPIQLEAKTKIDPKESVKVSLTAISRQINVPWTATAIYWVDDEEINKDIGGVWSGAVVFNVRAKIDKLT